ncbi:hypothetical protein J6590_093398 [Homalodisca vitripennis]|nr:hypothetical protein J6590_093398 [Homalodisca vitripennis]
MGYVTSIGVARNEVTLRCFIIDLVNFGHTSHSTANVNVTLTIEPCCRKNYPSPTHPPRITVQPVDSRHNSQFSLVSPVLRSCQCERNLDNRAVLQDKLPLPYPPIQHNCPAGRLSAQQSVQFGVTCLALMPIAVLQDKPPLPYPPTPHNCPAGRISAQQLVQFGVTCLALMPMTNYPFPTRPSSITVQPVDSRHNSQFSLVSPVLRSCQCERNLDNRAVLQDKLPLPYPPIPHNCPASRISAQQLVQFGVTCLALMPMTNYPFPTRPSRITVQPVDSRHNSQFSLVSPVLRSCQCERNLHNRAVLQDKLPLPYPPISHNCPAGRLSAQQSVQFGVTCLALMQMPLISGMC